jgi:cell division protein FtsL
MYWRLLNVGVVAGLVVAAAAVYDIKYQSTLRAQRVAKLEKDLRQERDAVAGLRAQWARLSNPRRIQSLAERHLSLVPVQANQFVDFNDLPARPPQAARPAGENPIVSLLDGSEDAAMATGSIDSQRSGAKVP